MTYDYYTPQRDGNHGDVISGTVKSGDRARVELTRVSAEIDPGRVAQDIRDGTLPRPEILNHSVGTTISYQEVNTDLSKKAAEEGRTFIPISDANFRERRQEVREWLKESRPALYDRLVGFEELCREVHGPVTASAGNDGPERFNLTAVADEPNLVIVGADDKNGLRAPYSQMGDLYVNGESEQYPIVGSNGSRVGTLHTLGGSVVFDRTENRSISGKGIPTERESTNLDAQGPHVKWLAGIEVTEFDGSERVFTADQVREAATLAVDDPEQSRTLFELSECLRSTNKSILGQDALELINENLSPAAMKVALSGLEGKNLADVQATPEDVENLRLVIPGVREASSTSASTSDGDPLGLFTSKTETGPPTPSQPPSQSGDHNYKLYSGQQIQDLAQSVTDPVLKQLVTAIGRGFERRGEYLDAETLSAVLEKRTMVEYQDSPVKVYSSFSVEQGVVTYRPGDSPLASTPTEGTSWAAPRVAAQLIRLAGEKSRSE